MFQAQYRADITKHMYSNQQSTFSSGFDGNTTLGMIS